ncbi:MAG: Aminoacyltransferase FemX [Thermoanaerobacterales bacterium 50_218]|nr:MAG: Aminoacyltransferase FemX [Thermoanaerobacterales bacterium 50_218]HAA89180.1 methicillin resistance protein [Peptococcaceae bacterium]
MYQFWLIEEKDKDLFNGFISSSPKPHFLQTYEWGELKKRTGWEPLRVLLTRNGEPIAAVSLLMRSLPAFQRTILYAPRGPIFGERCDQEGEDVFWNEVVKLARRHRAIFLKVDPDVPVNNQEYRLNLEKRGFRPQGTREGFGGVQPRFVFRLDLTPSEEQLLAAMHSKTRYNIRLAMRRGVRVRLAETKDDLKIFYKLLQETAKRDRFLIRSYEYFEGIWDLFVVSGKARVFLAEYQGEIIAGTLAFHCGDRAWYLYGASGNKHRNVMPNHLLQWEMIRWARSLGCKIYDFRGVPGDDNPENPLHGLYRFKKGFGAEFTEFIGEYDLVISPFWYLLWKKLFPWYRRVVQGRLQEESVSGD